MFVDGNLLDKIFTFDAYFLVSDEMLNDNVRHVLSESIAITIQTMYCTEDELVVGYCTILTSNGLQREHNYDKISENNQLCNTQQVITSLIRMLVLQNIHQLLHHWDALDFELQYLPEQ